MQRDRMSQPATTLSNGPNGAPTAAERPRASLSIALTGSGGAGVITAGGLLLAAAAKAGWYGLQTRSVGPQIRGGEAAALVRLGVGPVAVHDDRFHVVIGLDWRNVERFGAELPLGPDSLVIGDPAAGDIPAALTGHGVRTLSLPLKEIAAGIEGGRVNMVAVGVAMALAGLPRAAVAAAITATLAAKSPAAVAAGIACLDAGAEAAPADFTRYRLAEPAPRPTSGAERWLIGGNQAIGLGAVRGGIRFAAAYPITPATEILEWLADALPKVGGNLVQAEDELASINMAVGAAYGGKPALTATSGPGFALMTEALGLATAAEVPVVVVDVMRGGPSTGIPTKPEQSDLHIALYGLHGDAPHVVVAPTGIGDCLFTAQWATHLAEALQVPAVVLSDQFLGQAKAVIDRPAELAFIARREVAVGPDYRRYADTPTGVSPMALPGTPGGQYTADGLSHAPDGAPSSGQADHLRQLDKRAAKLARFDFGRHWAELTGDGEAETAILTWGSVAGPAREAVARLAAGGTPCRLIALRLLAPAQTGRLAEALEGVTRVLVVEQTHSGQFRRYLRAEYDIAAEVRTLKRPSPISFHPDEIVQAVRNWRSP